MRARVGLLSTACALAALAGAWSACGGAPDEHPRAAILLVLDTVRADALSCYGAERPTTPALDRLAAEGVRFERALTCAPWTLPGVAAILSARYPFGGVSGGRVPARSEVERFRAAGFTTAAFTEGGYVSRAFGLERGFESWVEEEGPVQLLDPGAPPDPSRTGGIERTFAQAQAWLREHAHERFFLLVHTYEAHAPYVSHAFTAGLDPGRVGPVFALETSQKLQRGELVLTPAEREYVRALYQGDVHTADEHVGRLLALLDELGVADEVLVSVVSDHGEELGEHYPSNTGSHGHSLRDPLVRVPWILRDPHGPRGLVVRPQVRTLDVLPTIAERLGVALADDVAGRSAWPLVTGAQHDERPALLGWNKVGPDRLGLSEKGFKSIAIVGRHPDSPPMREEPPAQQLYDLTADPRELVNLAPARAPLARAMQEAAGRLAEGHAQQIPRAALEQVDERLRERLRSLGYVE